MKKIYLFCLLPLLLTGCDESFNQDELKTQYNRLLGMNIKTSIEHCSTKDDVPNCHFENGIYVLKIGSSVTDEQQQRVKVQVTDFISGSHPEVRRLFANKRIVIGLVEKEPDPSTLSPQDEFILALADSVNQANGLPKVLDGIELVYTNLEDDDGNGNKIYIDETKKLAGYQKLVQLFDYYVDQNQNSAPGSELEAAYKEFLQILDDQSNQGYPEYLTYDQCNYGNGQLPANTCTVDPDDDPDGTGTRDPIHTLNANLNMGAIIGMTHDYMKDPTKNTTGELEGSNGSSFNNSGVIGTGSADAIDWSNPAFKPLADYINKWLLNR